MRKFIGIGLVLGLAVSMYVVETNDNGKSNSLTVESDYLLLNNDITNAENLIKLEEKKEESKSEELLWLKD